jgi:hypothetical protein
MFNKATSAQTYFPGANQGYITKVKNDLDMIHDEPSPRLAMTLYEEAKQEWHKLH